MSSKVDFVHLTTMPMNANCCHETCMKKQSNQTLIIIYKLKKKTEFSCFFQWKFYFTNKKIITFVPYFLPCCNEKYSGNESKQIL